MPGPATWSISKDAARLILACTGAPETFLIDHQGIIRHKHIGPIDQTVFDDLMRRIFELKGGEGRMKRRVTVSGFRFPEWHMPGLVLVSMLVLAFGGRYGFGVWVGD